jgi:Zn-dependent protease with chaperone function
MSRHRLLAARAWLVEDRAVEAILGEGALRRNRRRIWALAVVGLLNFWVGAILLTFAVVVGAVLALIVEGVVESADFDLLFALLRSVPRAVSWLATSGWAASTAARVVVLGFVVSVSLVGLALIVGRLRSVDSRVLAETGARPAPDPVVQGMLEGLAIAAGVSPPGVAFIDDPAPNSYSVGRRPETSTVVVTTGLVEKLGRYEVEAILAYELSRVVSFDTALSTWTVAVAGRTLELYRQTGRISAKLALLGPSLVARWVQGRVLRRQAMQRDMFAVGFTRYPQALVDALEKIERDPAVVAAATVGNAALWLEYPAVGYRDRPSGLPALAERIGRLRALVGS